MTLIDYDILKDKLKGSMPAPTAIMPGLSDFQDKFCNDGLCFIVFFFPLSFSVCFYGPVRLFDISLKTRHRMRAAGFVTETRALLHFSIGNPTDAKLSECVRAPRATFRRLKHKETIARCYTKREKRKIAVV